MTSHQTILYTYIFTFVLFINSLHSCVPVDEVTLEDSNDGNNKLELQNICGILKGQFYLSLFENATKEIILEPSPSISWTLSFPVPPPNLQFT